jgi:hypothetical protein
LTKSECDPKLTLFSSSTKKFNITYNSLDKNIVNDPPFSSTNSCQIDVDEISSNTRSLQSELKVKNSSNKFFLTELGINTNTMKSTSNQKVNKSTSLNNLNKKKSNQVSELVLFEENAITDKEGSNINSNNNENLDESISIEFDFNNNNNNFRNNNGYQLIKK